jgi:Bifunctional DNA primase/polymerase, N-terminal/AAA domain
MTLHEAARQYALAGWPIFPIQPNAKIPFPGSRGHDEATTDLSIIDAWWEAEPNANIGFVPEGAGLCVIDVDPGSDFPLDPHAHAQWACTPRDGTHMYYAGSLPPTQSKIAPHVDTRGRHSYVLVPPSVVDGNHYTWQCDAPFDSWDCPIIPEWIVEKCKPKVEERRIASDYVEDKPEAIRQAELWLKLQSQPVEFAGSDGQCYQVAARLLDFGLSADRVLDMMGEWSGFDPDWLQEKIDHAAQYRQNEEGCDVPTSNKEAFGPAVKAGIEGSTSSSKQAESLDRFAWHKPTEYRDRPPITFYDADHMLPHEQRGSVGVMYGASGHHKTNTLLTMLMQTMEDHDDAFVLYVAGEGVDGFGRDRVWAHARARDKSDDWINSHLAIVETMPILTDVDDMKAFFAAAPRRPSIVVIDTLATGTPGTDENAKAMSDILSGNGAAGAIRRQWNALVICVAHSGKDETRGVRGHSGQFGNADFILHISKDKDAPCAIKLKCEKMRDGEREGRESYYQVESTGVPVPVRITEGEYRDLTRVSPEDAQSTQERMVRIVLRQEGADSWMRGLSTERLIDAIMLYEHGERPEPGAPGAQPWFDARKSCREALRKAQPKKWAAALYEERLPDGVDDTAPREGRWRLLS